MYKKPSLSALIKSGKAREVRPKSAPSTYKFRRSVPRAGSSRSEIKNYDNNITATSVGTGSPYVASLCSGIAEGTSDSQRIGQKIMLRSIELEMNVTIANFGGANLPTFLDVFIVWDRQPNQALAAATSIFASATTNLTFLNTSNTERFKVVRRVRLELDTSSRIGNSFSLHVPLALATKFPDSNTFPSTNDILLCALSPNTVGSSGNNPSISYIARVKYTDN